MLETLLRTKLFIPPLRPNRVSRPQLIDRLNQGLQLGHKLTLISAPAGFGKTTLVSEWVGNLSKDEGKESQTGNRVSWLSLDENDNDPTRFLTYLVTTLNQENGIETTIGKGALGMLQSPQPPWTEPVLTSLINDIKVIPDRIILVLDDYHVTTSSPVDDAITFLLENLPPQMHLVIATRIDPNLPLARLRARGQFTELRATDLRFTSSEAAEFLNQVMGLDLSEEDIAALETRTEGWIAGMQLAAISIQGQKDATNFIKSFTGSHHFVLDYLIEEVLEQQSKSVQTFLLMTAILDRFNGSLCDALTGQDNGQETLELLEHSNLFVVPLDEERRWYRYHHLFSDLLRRRLLQTQLEQVPTLHHRASEWFVHNGHTPQAIDHALAAGDFEGAADLIEQVAETTFMRSEVATFLNWIADLPDEFVGARPLLCVYQAGGMLLKSHPLSNVEVRLQQAEEVDVDGHIAGEVAAFRALIAALQGNALLSVELSRQALELLPEDNLFLRSIITDNLGITHLMRGETEAAIHYLNEAARTGQKVGNVMSAVGALSNLAGLCMLQGQLKKAETIYQQALEYATDADGSRLPIAGKALLGFGELAREWNDLDTAQQYLSDGMMHFGQYGEIGAMIGYVSLARAKQAQEDMVSAYDYLQKARQMAVNFDATEIDDVLVDTYEAWFRLQEGQVAAAAHWAETRGLDEQAIPKADGETPYLDIHEVELSVLARLFLAQGKTDQALAVLEPLLQASRQTGRKRSTLRLMAQQAVTYYAIEDKEQALSVLGQALSLAEPEGFVRTFVDEGEPMAQLLYLAMENGIEVEYSGKLLAALEGTTIDQRTLEKGKPSPVAGDPSTLIEPLSGREIEVLQLIAEGLTNREIGERLFLSLNTVKVHTRNIYGKLDTHNRTQAVARARALGILPPT
jgi:LuxR family maltose regulon positive regulatory protein